MGYNVDFTDFPNLLDTQKKLRNPAKKLIMDIHQEAKYM